MNKVSSNASRKLKSLVSARNPEELSQLLLAAQEEERQRIAVDLHDEIGQCLSAIQFAFGGLRQRLEDRMTDLEKEVCAHLCQRVAQAIEEVRRICMGLRPPMLDDLGVVSAIDWFCAGLRQVLVGVDVHQEVRADEEAIARPVKVAIFRILQEACSNACKHSRAHRLLVLLETDAEGIRLEVADDGVGFDSAFVRRYRKGFGFASMRERATMTGGSLTIRSEVGGGTRVQAVWRVQGVSHEPRDAVSGGICGVAV
jgi:two-component system sensor histidine kinase UhpB